MFKKDYSIKKLLFRNKKLGWKKWAIVNGHLRILYKMAEEANEYPYPSPPIDYDKLYKILSGN